MSFLENTIEAAAEALKNGQLVVFPTETVYGVGADARSGEACARIFEAKGRPRFNPLIVHVSERDQLTEVVSEIPPDAKRLAEKFWPGPLTLVLPKRPAICDLATGDLATVGVRVPAHPLARRLLTLAAIPVAAPSANRFMGISPTRVEHARAQLGKSVAAYLDGGPCEVGVESTIVGWFEGRACLLRLGGLAVEAIEAEIGKLAPTPAKIVAPGMLARHYAPSTPCLLESASSPWGKSVALLTLSAEPKDHERYEWTHELSAEGDLVRAAAKLFETLHALEAKNCSAIVVRLVPETGLGRAINDRLRRATTIL